MEWVSAVETMMKVIAEHSAQITEAKRMGVAVDFNAFASMALRAIQDTIAKGDFPDPVKQAASELARASEMQPATLGGKLRGSLKGISPNDQEDIVQDTIFTYISNLHNMMADHPLMRAKEVDADDLGSYLSGTLQRQATWQKQTFFRKAGRRPPTVTDVAGDDGQAPEASYEDGTDEPVKSGVGLSRGTWNKAIELVMNVEQSIRHRIETIQAGKTRQKTGQLEGRADMLVVTAAIMRNLPHQMAAQLGGTEEDDSDEQPTLPQDRQTGDNFVYDRLKSMVSDETSDMHPGDRSLLKKWAGQKGGYDHDQRKLIATAIWMASGMKPDEKPKKSVDDEHWFIDYALELDNAIPDE